MNLITLYKMLIVYITIHASENGFHRIVKTVTMNLIIVL